MSGPEPRITRWTEEHVELRFDDLEMEVLDGKRLLVVTRSYTKLRRRVGGPWQGARWATRVHYRQVRKDGTLGVERHPQFSPNSAIDAVLELLPDEFKEVR